MAVTFRDVLQQCHTWLMDYLADISDLNDHLFQGKVIKGDDIERISVEPTRREKCRKLLRIICSKDENAYRKFLLAIEKTEQDHVHQHLKEQEVILNLENVFKVNYESQCNSHVTYNMLKSSIPKDLEKECTDTLIDGAIEAVFLSAEISEDEKGSKIVKNVSKKISEKKKTDEIGTSTMVALNVQSVEAKGMTVKEWDVCDVGLWLHKQKLPPDVIKDFEEEAVDGMALLDLTEDDLKSDELPHVKLGHRKRILAKIRELNNNWLEKVDCNSKKDCEATELIKVRENVSGDVQSELLQTSEAAKENKPKVSESNNEESTAGSNSSNYQSSSFSAENLSPVKCNIKSGSENAGSTIMNMPFYPRKFDSGSVKPSEYYKKNRQMRMANWRPTDMLEPLAYYLPIDLTHPDGIVLFARKLVQFICACMNERTNGRIYFGVDEGGKVIGTKIDKEIVKYEKMVTNLMSKCFFQDQTDTIMNCVRPPNFIKILEEDSESDANLYVCEVDVVPSADICKDEAFFARCPRELEANTNKIHVDKAALFRYVDGGFVSVEDEELKKFMEIKVKLFDLRKYRENVHIKYLERLAREPSDIAKKLIRLLSLGVGKNADLYPILVTGKLKCGSSTDFIKDNLSFIGNIKWKGVFDFDADAKLQRVLENDLGMVARIVPCVSALDEHSPENVNDPELIKTLQDDIVSSTQIHWIFGNGYNASSKFPMLLPVQWTREKREAFKECVRYFRNVIPKGRAIIVFTVFSPDDFVLIEAMQEFISVFRDQWVLITEEEDTIAEPIFAELLRRRCAEEKNELDSRSVIGMSWNHVQETVSQVYGPKIIGVCTLPCSDGTLVSLKEKIKNEMNDLEILSADECCNSEIVQSHATEELKSFEREQETEFYKGGEVSWWNFWFKTHVLRRNIYAELSQNVRKNLRGFLPEDSYIGKVSVYHQPGAGGSTTAKQVLWGFKDTNRCAIVKNITEGTANQIIKLRSFNNDKPQPVLLLMDNLDEEPSNVLLAELEELAKQALRSGDNIDVKIPFCVVLICFRRSKMPRNDKQTYRTLIFHELDNNEIRWFQKKNEELEKRQDQCNESNMPIVDPKLLISFNIMRKNFDGRYIQRITKDMVKAISNIKERRLLKYIAMLNAFDLRFREIPSAAFDNMMVDLLWTPGPRYGRGAAARCWETKLSSEFRVLINETSSMSFRSIKALRITNPLLSKEVLLALQQLEDSDETISLMALKFFNCKEIFNVACHAKEELLKIIKDVMKHRGRLPSGQPEAKFAPLVQYVIDNESVDCAVKVLEMALELTGDAYISQQLARLNIFSENWEQATKYAELAIGEKPESSYLWDTYGRVYKAQMAEEYKSMSLSYKKLDVPDMLNLVAIATKGAEIFRKVQALSDKERRGLPTNNAGYFGELEITECLLHCLNNAACFKTKQDMKRCIVDENYFPDELQAVAHTEEGAVLYKLKEINNSTQRAMNKLEDERMQLRDDTIDQYRHNSIIQRNKKMEVIQANLDIYLGEDSNDLPPEMDSKSEEACRRRRRRMNTLGANSLRRIFALNVWLDGETVLGNIRKLSIDNIRSEKGTAFDYQTAIGVSLALACKSPKYVHQFHNNITYDDIVMWSHKLFEMREVSNGIIYLEPYLFYVMFNWPRKGTKHEVTPNILRQTIYKWREAYYRKWPSQREGEKPYKKKDTTIFFFSYGSDMSSVINYHDLIGAEYKRSAARADDFWKEPKVLRTLERFSGILSSDGETVQIKLECASGHKDSIDIQTSFPIRDRNKWNKNVFFVIGFSWMGPKAFDIDLNDPTNSDKNLAYMVQNHQVSLRDKDHIKSEKPVSTYTHVQITEMLTMINEKLKEIEKLNRERDGGKTLSKKQRQFVDSEDRIKRERADVLYHRQKLIDRMREF